MSTPPSSLPPFARSDAEIDWRKYRLVLRFKLGSAGSTLYCSKGLHRGENNVTDCIAALVRHLTSHFFLKTFICMCKIFSMLTEGGFFFFWFVCFILDNWSLYFFAAHPFVGKSLWKPNFVIKWPYLLSEYQCCSEAALQFWGESKRWGHDVFGCNVSE